MDGVLVDSVDAQVAALARFFGRHRIAFGREHLARLNGPSVREILMIMKREHRLTFDCDEAVAELQQAWMTSDSTREFPGARPTVIALRLRGHRIAVASSAPVATIRHFCGAWPLDAVVSGDEVARAKPDRAIFVRAADKLGITPADCAVVEDAPNGLEAARAAGMLRIGITNTVPAHQLNADAIVDRIEDLLSLPALFAREILFQPAEPVPAEHVGLNVTWESQPVPDTIAAAARQAWDAEPDSPQRFNGCVANLLDYEAGRDRVSLRASLTDYKTYRWLRGQPDYDIFAHGICVLGTAGLVITSDAKAILARRGRGLVGEGMWHTLPGGMLDPTQRESPLESILGELSEEMNILSRDVRSCVFVGIAHDLISRGAELLFVMRVRQTAAEVFDAHRRATNACEADDLRAVPVTALPSYLGDPTMMPASQALIRCFLTASAGGEGAHAPAR